MAYLVVSWYTPDYKRQNDNLLASLAKHGITEHVEYEMQPVGKWLANVMLKPQVLKRAFEQHPDHDIVYLDSDAVVHGPLTLFDCWTGEDMGFHFRGGVELLGGTMYLRNIPRVWTFCDKVAAMMQTAQTCWQVTAQRLLPQCEVSVRRLPPTYACIFDMMRKQHPGIEPVIEHMQYSRQVAH